MFNGKCTLFVLGAGSGVDFGFPPGIKLRQNIREIKPENYLKIVKRSIRGPERAQSMQEVQEAARRRKTGHEIEADRQLAAKMKEIEPQLREFLNRFNESPDYSIDEWLTNWPQLRDIGCLILAYHILKAEAESNVFPHHETWAQFLIKLCGNSKDKFRCSRFKIITFNYDRGIEHFLYKTLTNKYGFSPEESKRLLGEKDIHHIHGKLAALEWEGLPEDEVIRYGDFKISYERLVAAASRIKVVHETGRSDELSQQAIRMLYDAHNVVFLGFAFNHQNMRKLGMPPSNETERGDQWLHQLENPWHGTCLGIEGTELKQLKANFPDIKFYNRTALDILKHEEIL